MQNNTLYTVTDMLWSHAAKVCPTGVRRKLKQFYKFFFQISHVIHVLRSLCVWLHCRYVCRLEYSVYTDVLESFDESGIRSVHTSDDVGC